MKYVISALFIVIQVGLYGQLSSNNRVIEIIYGSSNYSGEKNFKERINEDLNSNLAIETINYGFLFGEVFVWARGGDIDGELSYTQIHKTSSESSVGLIEYSGYNFGMSLYGGDAFRDLEKIDVIISAGFNTGWRKIKLESVHRNPYFAFKVRTELRIILGRVTFSAILDSQVDISSSEWKSDDFSTELLDTKYSGFRSFIGVGYLLN